MAGHRHHHRWILLAILLAGFALRVLLLQAQSLWYDEGVSAWLARQPILTVLDWTARDVQPPLYYLTLGGWVRLAGSSEYGLRFLSVACGFLAIPLFYRLTWALWPSGAARFWAAAFAAFHPLLLYYAQEARMYSLLLALALVAALLIAPALRGAMAWRRWFAYALTGVLIAYTHYFALFLLIAFGAAWLVGWMHHRQSLVRFVVANVAVLLCVVPWLVVALPSLRVDASYWGGAFDAVDALHDVVIRFVAGETAPERRAIWIAVVLLAAVGAGLVWLWRRRRADRLALTFALLWALIPLAGALALAYGAPKFNPRYVLIALPGLLLLCAFLLESLASARTTATRWLTLLLAMVLFTPFIWSSGNWYLSHEFDKAQWRQLAEYLRPRRTPDEALILVSGHAWPVWDYYAPDMPALRLPDIETLDVNAILDFESSGGPLRAALADFPGAWLIGWQDEIVDPNEVVPTQLELAGREKGSSARFHLLSLRRFSRIHANRTAAEPPISVPVEADFGGKVRLAGYHPLDNGDLLLFWSLVGPSTGEDYHMAVEVQDASGSTLRHVADRRPAGYAYPSFRWKPGAIVMGRIPAQDWLGDDPAVADYTLRLRVYDAAGASLTPLTLADGSDTLTLHDVRPVLE